MKRAGFAILLGLSAFAADEIRTRNLWNSAFSGQRLSRSQAALDLRPTLGDSFVGVTLFKMRLSKASDPVKFRGLVHDEDQTEWTPERSDLNAPIRGNEMVRLSIESARKGYLYVIDRDIYPDGTFSKPSLIFPTTRLRSGDNQVEPGFLIEIPDAQDKPPAFRVEETRAGPNRRDVDHHRGARADPLGLQR